MKIKSLIDVGLCFFLTIGVRAQTTKQLVIELTHGADSSKPSVPFCSIKVIDARFDQSHIGCTVRDYSFDGRTINKKEAVFPQPLNAYLPEVLSRLVLLDKTSADTLVLMIKRFRIADYVRMPKTATRMGRGASPQNHYLQLFMDISVSFFLLHNNQYSRLFGLDDLMDENLNGEREIKAQDIFVYRERALEKMLTQIMNNRTWKPQSGPAFSPDDIAKGIEKRFDLPALHDTAYPVGLYRSFAEFIKNAPSFTAITFTHKKNQPAELKDSSGHAINLNEFWGMSDGNRRFIVFRKRLNQLEQSDHSFKFTSFRRMTDADPVSAYGNYATENGLLGGALLSAPGIVAQNETFYLNMDKGDVYLEEIFGRSSLKYKHKEILQ